MIARLVFSIFHQLKSHLIELVLNLFQGLVAKFANLDHFLLGLADQILNRIDVGALQAIEAAHGKIQFFGVYGQ